MVAGLFLQNIFADTLLQRSGEHDVDGHDVLHEGGPAGSGSGPSSAIFTTKKIYFAGNINTFPRSNFPNHWHTSRFWLDTLRPSSFGLFGVHLQTPAPEKTINKY